MSSGNPSQPPHSGKNLAPSTASQPANADRTTGETPSRPSGVLWGNRLSAPQSGKQGKADVPATPPSREPFPSWMSDQRLTALQELQVSRSATVAPITINRSREVKAARERLRNQAMGLDAEDIAAELSEMGEGRESVPRWDDPGFGRPRVVRD